MIACAYCGGPFSVDRDHPTRGKYCSKQCFYEGRKAARLTRTRERFEEQYVPEPNSGCWIWTGRVLAKAGGYGRLDVAGVDVRAHRLSYELFKGPIPDGLMVRHQCDNPPCVNPDHLVLGTQTDNMGDAVERLRMPRGSKHHNAKLTEAEVALIRNDKRSGRALARILGVSEQTISGIRNGHTWRI